jgi:hypothetical protein
MFVTTSQLVCIGLAWVASVVLVVYRAARMVEVVAEKSRPKAQQKSPLAMRTIFDGGN